MVRRRGTKRKQVKRAQKKQRAERVRSHVRALKTKLKAQAKRRPLKLTPRYREDYDPVVCEIHEQSGVPLWQIAAQSEDLNLWANPRSDEFDHERLVNWIEDMSELTGIDEDDLWELWHIAFYGKSREQ